MLVAHYYVDGDLQDLALETGGCVADSLEMARFGRDHASRTLVVAGVRFMGETAKILSPDKRVLMPDLDATCSLDLGCPADEFGAFCDAHPDRTVVVYANTSAAVKARADWMVTSSCALPIVSHLKAQGQKILWAPDRHLGRYIQEQTGADMLLWNGACIVHDEFKGLELELLRREHPERAGAGAPRVAAERGRAGRRGRLDDGAAQGRGRRQRAANTSSPPTTALMHRMRQLAPGKTLLEAPTAGSSATCKSCAHCPWMAMNALQGVVACLETGRGEIVLDEAVRSRALGCIERMLDFVEQHPAGVAAPGFVPQLGAA